MQPATRVLPRHRCKHEAPLSQRYWSKIADLNLPHLYLAPRLGMTPLEFCRYFWRQKTGVPVLSYGVVCVIPCDPMIQNSLARTVVKAPKSVISLPLYWLRITKRIEYKLLSLTSNVLTFTQPPYLHNLISVQRPRSTRSSSVVTLARPPTSSSLKNY